VGISIHYRGRLNDLGQLTVLCEELTDIAAAMRWRSLSLDDDWGRPADARLRITPAGAQIDGHLGLKGIEIKPGANVESLSFFFDREGNLRSLMGMALILGGTLDPERAWISVKTQFGSPETHAWIIGLLKYLKKQYITDLQVSDDGEYWETGNLQILKEKMDLINEKLDLIERKLSSIDFGDVSGLSAEQTAAKIERFLLGIKDGKAEQNGSF